MDSLAKILRKDRMKHGAIAFDRAEVRFNLNEESQPIGVYFKISKDANHLIEEFMLWLIKGIGVCFSYQKERAYKQYIYLSYSR